MASVTVSSVDNLQQLVVTSAHKFMADEPEEEGGDGRGPTPYDLLLSSLGSCTGMTLLMYTRRKGWPLEAVTVELDHQRVHRDDSEKSETSGKAYMEIISRRIALHGDLTEEQRDRIAYIAARCPVSRTLQANPLVEDEVEVVSRPEPLSQAD